MVGKWSKRKKEKTETLPEELYKSVNVKDLTLEELRASRLPDESLISIWVEFTSPDNRYYGAVHVYEHPTGPYILLFSKEKDIKDFEYVERVVADITKGVPENDITDRIDDICDVINLKGKPIQAVVADFIEGYERHFENVKIPGAYFKNIPKYVYENSGLPQEKLRFEE